MALRVTNITGTFEDGRESTGFLMDTYLCSNLLGVPGYLKKKWDVVGIISGHGKVRVGKSTLAFQVASLLAWLNAGGRIDMKEVTDDRGKKKFVISNVVQPKEKLKFSLEENVVFSAIDLKSTAQKLFAKYGRNQIIIYDEGREGLEGARAMENLNKVMQDFFQECGFMGMIILIVLPNFFKLHEDYAVSRSVFLIDCFHDKQKRRGYFNFYTETDKEWLYFLGKKQIGITHKYRAAHETFWGRFTSWFPFDRLEYEKLKAEALKKRAKTRREVQYKEQRDALIYTMNRENVKLPISAEKIKKYIEKYSKDTISSEIITKTCESMFQKLQEKTEEDLESS